MASYTQLYVHYVWSTARRRPLITPVIEAELYPLMAAKCLTLNCLAFAIGGVSDHIHMLVRFDPMLPISKLIGQVKGSSAHAINHVVCPGYHFDWQDGYGAFTVSKRSIDVVRAYVLGQKQRHARGLLIDELEQTDIPEAPEDD